MPTKKIHKKYKKTHKKIDTLPIVKTVWAMNTKKCEYKDGILYNKEKNVIYNPDIAPYPIKQEKQYINVVPREQNLSLEKQVHFAPFHKIEPQSTSPSLQIIPNKIDILYEKKDNPIIESFNKIYKPRKYNTTYKKHKKEKKSKNIKDSLLLYRGKKRYNK